MREHGGGAMKNAHTSYEDVSARTAQSYNKTAAIKAAFERGEKLTGRDAVHRFKCYRLAAVVHKLRRSGIEVQSEIVKSADGERFARYWLSTGEA